jgi:hypothetical protein
MILHEIIIISCMLIIMAGVALSLCVTITTTCTLVASEKPDQLTAPTTASSRKRKNLLRWRFVVGSVVYVRLSHHELRKVPSINRRSLSHHHDIIMRVCVGLVFIDALEEHYHQKEQAV